MTKYLKQYLQEFFTSRDDYEASKQTHGLGGASEMELVRRGGDLLTRHYDIPGIPRVRHDAPANPGPLIWVEEEFTALILAMVQMSTASGSWMDKPFWIGVYLLDEVTRTRIWRELEKGFERNNKAPSLEKLHTDCFVINNRPYWNVRIRAVCIRAYEGGPSQLPLISFS